eukprot:1339208-Amorphochlora_amoeboformis.AAC.1
MPTNKGIDALIREGWVEPKGNKQILGQEEGISIARVGWRCRQGPMGMGWRRRVREGMQHI